MLILMVSKDEMLAKAIKTAFSFVVTDVRRGQDEERPQAACVGSDRGDL